MWWRGGRNRNPVRTIDGIDVYLSDEVALVSYDAFFYSKPDEGSERFLISLLNVKDMQALPEGYRVSPGFFGDGIEVELIGVKKDDPAWTLIYLPITNGKYSRMRLASTDEVIDRCWVKSDMVSRRRRA
jgi:hypothetical protein